jgi:trimethylamine---corrinoid protein Co-methyltransferase
MRNGAVDANGRAEKVYQKKLADYEAPPLDDGIRAELEDYVTRRRRELGD